MCNGIQTVGPWSPQEQTMHINCLELLAAHLAIKCFAKINTNLTIHLKMDRVSALTYINKLGGTISPQLNYLPKELWLWCMERNTLLKAQHLPATADNQSRVMKDCTDWMLCPTIFHQINVKTRSRPTGFLRSRIMDRNHGIQVLKQNSN